MWFMLISNWIMGLFILAAYLSDKTMHSKLQMLKTIGISLLILCAGFYGSVIFLILMGTLQAIAYQFRKFLNLPLR